MILDAAKPLLSSRPLAYVVISLAAIVFALFLGKDIHWDQLNYHYYLGFSVLHDRLAQDFMPASIQSYFVPYAYVPFAWMVERQVSDQTIVAVLAFLGSISIWATWELGGRLCAPAVETGPLPFNGVGAWLSAATAAATPIVLSQIGSSFIDLTAAAPVLWGYVVAPAKLQKPICRKASRALAQP